MDLTVEWWAVIQVLISDPLCRPDGRVDRVGLPVAIHIAPSASLHDEVTSLLKQTSKCFVIDDKNPVHLIVDRAYDGGTLDYLLSAEYGIGLIGPHRQLTSTRDGHCVCPSIVGRLSIYLRGCRISAAYKYLASIIHRTFWDLSS
jgi:hypothetical protein